MVAVRCKLLFVHAAGKTFLFTTQLELKLPSQHVKISAAGQKPWVDQDGLSNHRAVSKSTTDHLTEMTLPTHSTSRLEDAHYTLKSTKPWNLKCLSANYFNNNIYFFYHVD